MDKIERVASDNTPRLAPGHNRISNNRQTMFSSVNCIAPFVDFRRHEGSGMAWLT